MSWGLPTTTQALYGWIAAMIGGYVAIAYAIQGFRRLRKWNYKTNFVRRLFDGVTFSGSALLLIAVFDDQVLAIIGDTKLFLVVAAIAGVGYALHALFDL